MGQKYCNWQSAINYVNPNIYDSIYIVIPQSNRLGTQNCDRLYQTILQSEIWSLHIFNICCWIDKIFGHNVRPDIFLKLQNYINSMLTPLPSGNLSGLLSLIQIVFLTRNEKRYFDESCFTLLKCNQFY